jgi:hypothetical protein
VDLFIELQMMTLAANLLIAIKNSYKPGYVKIAFGLTMVGIVDE